MTRIVQKIVAGWVYLLTGETTASIARMRPATARRTYAYSLCIPLPMLLWAISGATIGRVLGLGEGGAALVAVCAALMAYSVERIMILAPLSVAITTGRIVLGSVVALLTATVFDLSLHHREITNQLREQRVSAETAKFDRSLNQLEAAREEASRQLLDATRAQFAELDGTGGSRRPVRRLDQAPIYAARAAHAEKLSEKLDAATAAVGALQLQRDQRLAQIRAGDDALREAGLLERVNALQHYLRKDENRAGLVLWVLFFCFFAMIELTVAAIRTGFGESHEEKMSRHRDAIDQADSRRVVAAVIGPDHRAHRLLAQLDAGWRP
jgi:hypothetical protein